MVTPSAPTNPDSRPKRRHGSTKGWNSVSWTPPEMSPLNDATASAIFKPITIHIVTKLQMGQLDADASALSNTHGIICTGVGTGVGLRAVGATTALSHNLFDIVEAAEPSAALSSLDSFWNIIKWLKRRLNNKSTVSGSSLIVYKDDSTTTLSTQAVSDDGTTDTVGKAS